MYTCVIFISHKKTKMKKRAKILSAIFVVLAITSSAVALSKGELLQGRFGTSGTSGVSLPDLVPVPTATSLLFTGEVGVDSAGNVVDYDVTFDSKCAIRNTGGKIASGTSFSWCHFLYSTSAGDIIFSNPELFSLFLRSSTTLAYTATRTDVGDDSGEFDYYATYLDFFQDLYDGGGTMKMPVDHKLDYDSTFFVLKSDETNNLSRQWIVLTDDGISWVTR